MATLDVPNVIQAGDDATAAPLQENFVAIETWANGNVGTTNITDASVTTAKIAAANITNPLLAADCVKEANIDSEDFSIIGAAGKPAFENSWANLGSTYVPARYWKDVLGIVHVQAAISTGADGTVAFTLPVGYRPDYDQYHSASAGVAGAGRVLVKQNGEVTVNRGAISNVQFHITFPAA